MVRYDPYTDSFTGTPTKEAAINLDAFTKYIIQHTVEVSDESIEKIADAVVRKLADRKDDPQYDFGEYADRLWKIAYERGKREALEQTEPQTETPYACGKCPYHEQCSAEDWRSCRYDYVSGRYIDPQTERSDT